MELISLTLVTPGKHKLGERPPGERAKARIRLVLESVFSNLKRQMRLSDHLAKTAAGLAQRIAQRLLALTIGILVNLLTGRPAIRRLCGIEAAELMLVEAELEEVAPDVLETESSLEDELADLIAEPDRI